MNEYLRNCIITSNRPVLLHVLPVFVEYFDAHAIRPW